LSDLVAYLRTGNGDALTLRPGRRLRARVVRVVDGQATVAVAGIELTVATEAVLEAGSTVTLVVATVANGRIALRVEPG
jgi:hypothetical protein